MVKSDSASNPAGLTLFQRRIQQLKKGLYSESSSPDIDDPDLMTEMHRNGAKSDDSTIVLSQATEIPIKNERNSNSTRGSILSQRELEDQLTDDIRRSKQGLLNSDSETRDVLEILDEANWNEHVHKSSVVGTANQDDNGNMSDSSGSNEHVAQATPKESDNDEPQKKIPSDVSVEIHWMTLDPESTPLKNPDVVQLYIEYSFLGMRGSELETAMSLPKPTTDDQKLVYNYKKTFDVSSEKNNRQRMELKNLLTSTNGSHSIHFMIISEPLAEESESKDCEEIGQALVNMQTMLHEEHDYDPVSIAILSVDGRQENIGNLSVSVRGIETLMAIAAEK